jgi:hypothetical protein
MSFHVATLTPALCMSTLIASNRDPCSRSMHASTSCVCEAARTLCRLTFTPSSIASASCASRIVCWCAIGTRNGLRRGPASGAGVVSSSGASATSCAGNGTRNERSSPTSPSIGFGRTLGESRCAERNMSRCPRRMVRTSERGKGWGSPDSRRSNASTLAGLRASLDPVGRKRLR